MTYEPNQTWKLWLETQSMEQLKMSLSGREEELPKVEGEKAKELLTREIGMLREELARREEAERVKANFFPRVMIRNMKDAQIIGQLLHAHAVEVIGMSQNVMQYKRLEMHGFPVEINFTDPMTGQTTRDIDQVLSDLTDRALYTAELLAAVSGEIARLSDDENVTLNESEKDAFAEIVRLATSLRKEQK